MLDLLNKFIRGEDAVAAVELALSTPIFMLLFLSVTELGHMIWYSSTIEKGMRSGVTYAARNTIPLTEAVKTNTISLARTGGFDSNGAALVSGYRDGQDWSITVDDTKTYTETISGQSEDIYVTVVVLSVHVPYVPLMTFVSEEYLGALGVAVELTHEQAIIGD